MCILTTLNQGLRNGGGIGDVLRQPSSEEPLYLLRSDNYLDFIR
jgi:inositol 1,4,5-triphosphate receptor type 1